MIASASLRILGLSLAMLSGGSLFFSKCMEKKQPPVPDAAPVPVETASALPTSIEPMPLLEDAGPDADAEVKKPTGPYVNPNVARIRQCCNAIASQAKTLGASPEAATLTGLAGTCNGAAASLQSNPNAPELAMFKALLAGKNVPAICAGL